MKKTVHSVAGLAIVLAALPVLALAGEPSAKQSKKTSEKAADTKASAKPCSEYGAGFVRLEGSSTCVKIGGYVRFQTGVSR